MKRITEFESIDNHRWAVRQTAPIDPTMWCFSTYADYSTRQFYTVYGGDIEYYEPAGLVALLKRAPLWRRD